MKKEFFILFICFATYLNAQKKVDAGMWFTLSLSHPLNKKFSIVVDQEMRLRENYQRINLWYTNFGVSYKLNKNIKFEPTYRFIQKKKIEGYYSFRHRFMFDITAKKKINKFTVSERVRYQIEVTDYLTSKKGRLAEQYLRFRTDLKYNVSDRLRPYISCEVRLQISSHRGDRRLYDGDFHRIRNVVGAEYEINKKNAINLYYLIQSEFFISSPETIYILGLAYSLAI